MATSNQRTVFHARSNSLPSRSNPIITQLGEHLCRLQASEDASKTSFFRGKLSSLLDLHECVNKLFQLPLTQQARVQENNEKWVDELLDGSLHVLDFCNTAKDALLQTKERVHKLQLIFLRRRDYGEIGLTSEVKKYLTSRNVKALKGMQNNCNFSASQEDHETSNIFVMLKDVEAISPNVFENLACLCFWTKDKAYWLVISFQAGTTKN